MGGELDYVDSSTLAHAFKGRRPLECAYLAMGRIHIRP